MILETLLFKDPNELTLIIDGVEITVTSARLLRSMDTCADAFTAVMPWEPEPLLSSDPIGNKKINAATAPYGYQNSGVYLGGNLHMQGFLYNVTHRKGNDGWTKDLEIFSGTADIIDSTVVKPYEANYISLKNRCIQQCEPFAINVLVGDGVNLFKKKRVDIPIPGGPLKFKTAFIDTPLEVLPTYQTINFKREFQALDPVFYRTTFVDAEIIFPRVAAKKTDTVFEHLKKLAGQMGLLLSCTKYGDLLITKANITDIAVATITDESAIAETLEAKFSGRDRFTIYKAIGQTAQRRQSQKTSSAVDEAVTLYRLLTFQAGDIIPGFTGTAAEARKNKSAAEALTFELPVNTWYDDFGNLWEPNTKVNIISKVIGNSFTFLITKVEFKYDDKGSTAILGLKPPSVYTSGAIIEPDFSGGYL